MTPSSPAASPRCAITAPSGVRARNDWCQLAARRAAGRSAAVAATRPINGRAAPCSRTALPDTVRAAAALLPVEPPFAEHACICSWLRADQRDELQRALRRAAWRRSCTTRAAASVACLPKPRTEGGALPISEKFHREDAESANSPHMSKEQSGSKCLRRDTVPRLQALLAARRSQPPGAAATLGAGALAVQSRDFANRRSRRRAVAELLAIESVAARADFLPPGRIRDHARGKRDVLIAMASTQYRVLCRARRAWARRCPAR